MQSDRDFTIDRNVNRSPLYFSSGLSRFLEFLVYFVTYAFDEMPRPFFFSLGVSSLFFACATAFREATINWMNQSSCGPMRMKLLRVDTSRYCGHKGMHTPSTKMVCTNPSAPTAASKFLLHIFGFFGAVAPPEPDDFLFLTFGVNGVWLIASGTLFSPSPFTDLASESDEKSSSAARAAESS